MERKPTTETGKPEAERVTKKWWRRYGDGDWRWSEESWQTELAKTTEETP